VGFCTLISRISGFIRDIVFARLFGATPGMEAFLIAFKIPNFMRRLFAEGSFSQAFVPVLQSYKQHQNHQAMVHFIANVVGIMGTLLAGLAITGVLTADIWVMIFAPGFYDDPYKMTMAGHMLQITFPYILFISLTALAGSIMNCFEQFSVPAFTPVLLNVVIIGFALLHDHFKVATYAIAWGVLAAGIIQLLFQVPFLMRLKVLARPGWQWRHSGVKQLAKLMLPALFGSSVAQISLLFDMLFASFLMTGSISWLYYADRLNQFPLGVFGIALSIVVLPYLSKNYAEEDHVTYNHSMDWAFRLVWMITLPASIGLSLLAGPLLITLFQYGAFNAFDVYQSRWALMIYSAGLIFFVLTKLQVSAFYARKDMKTPVKVASIALLFNVVFAGVFVYFFHTQSWGHLGLASATSLSSAINAGLLFGILKRQKLYSPMPGWWFFGIRIILASFAMGAFLYCFQGNLNRWLQMALMDRAGYLAALVLSGILIYFISLFCLGIRKHHFVYH
jgi:putative peptidoglycan lipid II flippase